MVIRLAHEGFCGGDPERIENTRSDLVLNAWEYSNFQGEYLETGMEINKSNP